jgi:hypothetical protein
MSCCCEKKLGGRVITIQTGFLKQAAAVKNRLGQTYSTVAVKNCPDCENISVAIKSKTS